MKKTFRVAAVVSLVTALTGISPAWADALNKDFSGSDEYHLVVCASATELDCVQSLEFKDKKGSYVEAKATTTPLVEFSGQNGNRIHQQFTYWTANVDGSVKTARLDVPLQSPKYVIFMNADGSPHYGSSLRPFITAPDLVNTHVRLKIRTSFLIPQNVQLGAEESDFSQTKIAGGNLWMLEGKGTAISAYTSNYQAPERSSFAAQADVDSSDLHFNIHHGDKDLSRGFWPAVCGDKGYTVQAGNAVAGGSPSWNSQTKSLDFQVFAPHTKASGEPNLGFFKLWTTDAYVNCKWPGNNLTSASKLEVRIISEDGVTQTSTNMVTHKDGKIFVSALGFHYSTPTISVVPVSESPGTDNSSKPIAKTTKKTITCIKGKTTKKVTGTAPKCPAGYKIKK